MKSFLSKIHPKVAAGAIYALASNLVAVAGILAASGTWLEAIVALVLADGPIVVAWCKRADPRLVPIIDELAPVVEAALPVIVKEIETAPAPVVPEPGVWPATPAPAETVTPTGNIIS